MFAAPSTSLVGCFDAAATVSGLVDTSADHVSRRFVRTGIGDEDGQAVGITALHHVDAVLVRLVKAPPPQFGWLTLHDSLPLSASGVAAR